MSVITDRTSLPVLFLYNVDPAWPAADIDESVREAAMLDSGMQELGHPVTRIEVNQTDLEGLLRPYSPEDYIVFNWCEGLPGIPHSWVQVVATLESLDYVYTGSPSAVLELSDDKPRVKRLLDARRVPTPRWRVYKTSAPNAWSLFPAIVKPAEEHSSLGVSTEAVVTSPAELRHRIEYVLDTFHQPAIVEDFIDGREFHVSLWGNGTIEMLPVAEMDFSAFGDFHDRLCTYDAKFNSESVHYNKIGLNLPAPLEPEELRTLERVAVKAYRAIGCRDYARLDIRLRDGVFYVLDVNPNADITSEASFAYSASARGYSFGAMGSRLVNLAALRSPQFAEPEPVVA